MCPIGFLMLGSPCKTCRAIRPPHADQPAEGKPRCAPAPTNERSSRAPGLSWSAMRSSWPLPNHLPRRRPGPNRRLGWPSSACPSFEHEAPTQADDEPVMDAAATTPTPTIPAIRLPAPPPRSRTSLRPDTADAATHKHRTPTPDAGQRTPGRSDARTGHWTSVPWTGKRGHWSLAPDTGHRTPDTGEDVDRLTKARPASGPPGPPRRATARWDAQPCSCGRACGARQPIQARR
jgi:hypothetical protein